MTADLDSLGSAWQEAEAALPEGWRLKELLSSLGEWVASAEPTPAYQRCRHETPGTTWLGSGARGPTPAAALTALAEKLRAAKP